MVYSFLARATGPVRPVARVEPRLFCYLRSRDASRAFVPLNKRNAFKLRNAPDYKVPRFLGLFRAHNASLRARVQVMKADFDSWRARENARLDFCAATFPNVVSRRPRVLHSRLAHFAAPNTPSKAQSKRAQRPQSAQFPHLLGNYGAAGQVKAPISRVDGVKLTGFNEFIARKMA